MADDRPHPPPASAAGPASEAEPFLGRPWGLGEAAGLLLGVEGLTGLALLFAYRPALGTAFFDILDLQQAPFLRLCRDLHYWGGQALVIVVCLHLLRAFLGGHHRRRGAWWTGVALLLLTLALAATGALLPWDEAAYWGATVLPGAAGLPGAPGPPGDAALRFAYGLHVGLLPVALAGLAVYHLRRSRREEV